MSFGFHLTILGHTCQLSIYPINLQFFAQQEPGLVNYAFGPFRVMLHRPLTAKELGLEGK